MATSQAHLELWVCCLSSVGILTLSNRRNSDAMMQLWAHAKCFGSIAETDAHSAPGAWLSEYIATLNVIKCFTCSISILLILHGAVACIS